MDVLQLLFLAYSGDKENRTKAAAQLEEALQSSAGLQHLVTLLRAGADLTLPANQSLLALIYAKNCIMNTLTTEQVAAAPDLFEEVKTLLYNAAFCVSETHQRIIHASVSSIISMFEWDYLPKIMPEITRNRADVPVEQALASLRMLYVFIKRFKVPILDPMPMKLSVCCCLITALPQFLSYGNFEVDHLVFKAMECVVETALEVKDVRKLRPEELDQWFYEMAQYPERHFVASCEAAANGFVKTYEAYIRCLKRISMMSFSLLNSATRKKKPLPLAKRFLTTHAMSFFGVWQRWLEHATTSKEQNTHKKVDMFAIRYIKLCSLDQTLYQQCLLPQLEHMLKSILFPFLCLNEEDESVFADDSCLAEFAQYMMEEGFEQSEVSRRQVASNAILALVKGEKEFQVNCLQKIIDFLTTGLSQEDNENNFVQTFGFLHLLSILRKHLRKVPEIWKTQMSHVLMTLVVPRVLPTVSFAPLRCKALVVCQRFSKAPMASEGDFASFTGFICSLVQDADPKIRLGAIDAICTLLEMKRALPYIKPFLQPLVEECMCFLDRIQTTFVPCALLYLAQHFAPELTPLLSKIGKKLMQQFLAVAFDLAQQEDEKSTGLDIERYSAADMTAYTLLDALDTVVSAASHNAEVLCSLRPDVMFFAKKVLESPESFDYVEKTLSILLNVLNFSKPIPLECWDLLPVLFQCVESGLGVDFFSLIEEVLDSYVSNGTVEYMQNSDVMEATYQVCEKILFNPVCDIKDRIAVPQLIEAMLHQAKHCETIHGLFDAYLSRFVVLLLRALAAEANAVCGNVRLQVWIIAALMDAFYYNAAATLQIIDCNNANSQFFDALFCFFCGVINLQEDSKKGKQRKKGKCKKDNTANEVAESLSILTRKVIVLGLTALLEHLTANSNNNSNVAAGYCSNNNNNTLESFDKYIKPTLALIQYCVFTNNELLLSRCSITEKSLTRIRECIEEEDVDDIDLDDDDVIGVDDCGDADDVAMEDDYNNDYSDNNNNINEGDDFSGYCSDEGDEYKSPIDDVCEVTFFLGWISRAAALGGWLQQHIQCGLSKSPQEFCDAEATALRYRRLVEELDCALEEQHRARCTTASHN